MSEIWRKVEVFPLSGLSQVTRLYKAGPKGLGIGILFGMPMPCVVLKRLEKNAFRRTQTILSPIWRKIFEYS